MGRLVLCAHWTDDEASVALDRVALANYPLKAKGTEGVVAVVEGQAADDLMEALEGMRARTPEQPS